MGVTRHVRPPTRLGWFFVGTAAGGWAGGLAVWLMLQTGDAPSSKNSRRAGLQPAKELSGAGSRARTPQSDDPRKCILETLRRNGDLPGNATAALRSLPPKRWPEVLALLDEDVEGDQP